MPSRKKPIPIVGMSHLGICVRSLNKSLAFYRDLVGMKVVREETQKVDGAGWQYVYRGKRTGRHIVFLRYNDELNSSGTLAIFPTQGTGGSYEGVWSADINPENAGWSVTPNFGTGKQDGPATSQRFRGGPANSYYMTGGLPPGGSRPQALDAGSSLFLALFAGSGRCAGSDRSPRNGDPVTRR